MRRTLYPSIFLLFVLIGFTSMKTQPSELSPEPIKVIEIKTDEFDKVISKTKNASLKKKLKEFRKTGIEKEVKTSYEVDVIVDEAKKYLNTPHVMGGCSMDGIDCSGLVYTVHSEHGVQLPRSSQEQARFGEVVAEVDDLEKGDLLFFYNSYSSSSLITHVGIYIEDGEFIHTSSSKGVIVTDITNSSYWSERFLFGTRLHSDD